MTDSNTISVLGCGWLGLPLACSLVKSGYKVKGSTTRAEKLSTLRKEGITPFLLELNPETQNDAPFFASRTLIVNLPPKNRNGYVNYYERQLEHIKKSALRDGVKKIIFVSSTGVYPDTNQVVSERDASYDGLSRSGISLLQMEDIFRDDQLITTVVRFGGLYGGSRQPGNFLAGKKNIAGGNNPVNMIHLDDCIGIIRHILENDLWGMTFNGCSPNLPNREEFYKNAAEDLNIQPPTFSTEPKPFKKVSAALIQSEGYQFIH